MERTFLSHRKRRLISASTRTTLYTWVSDGRAPRSVRIGRRKYRQADLDAWLAKQEQIEDERLAGSSMLPVWPRRSGRVGEPLWPCPRTVFLGQAPWPAA